MILLCLQGFQPTHFLLPKIISGDHILGSQSLLAPMLWKHIFVQYNFQDFFIRRRENVSWEYVVKKHENVVKVSDNWIFKRSWKYVVKLSWKYLQLLEITWWKRLEKLFIFQNNLMKMSWNCCESVLKYYWHQTLWKMLWNHTFVLYHFLNFFIWRHENLSWNFKFSWNNIVKIK